MLLLTMAGRNKKLQSWGNDMHVSSAKTSMINHSDSGSRMLGPANSGFDSNNGWNNAALRALRFVLCTL